MDEKVKGNELTSLAALIGALEMRVALVMAGDEEGGLEKHVVELANGLASRHIDVSVVAHPKYAPRFDSKIGFLPADLSASRRNPLALWRLWRALRGTSADLVHATAARPQAWWPPSCRC